MSLVENKGIPQDAIKAVSKMFDRGSGVERTLSIKQNPDTGQTEVEYHLFPPVDPIRVAMMRIRNETSI